MYVCMYVIHLYVCMNVCEHTVTHNNTPTVARTDAGITEMVCGADEVAELQLNKAMSCQVTE